VAPLTKQVLRALASFSSEGPPVVSLYLDVDGKRHRRPRDYEAELRRLLRHAAVRATDGNGDPAATAAGRRWRRAHIGRAQSARERAAPLAADLARIEQQVRHGVDRSRTRGLALFSCAEAGLWEVVELPVPVRNQVVVDRAPHVRQLELVLEEQERVGVLLVDRQRSRLLIFEMGELVDRSEVFDELPRHEDDRGDWDRDHVADHRADAAHHHLRRAGQVAFQVFRAQGFEHLVLGGPEQVVAELEKELHSYLRDRIAARVSLPVGTRDEEIRHAAMEVQDAVRIQRQAAQVRRLRDRVGEGNGGAVVGLGPVLGALGEHRVHGLLVSDGYEEPGWRCASCQQLAPRGPSCNRCGATMDRVDDVVEAAVEEAVRQGCLVTSCVGDADLDVLGRIGALLRF
jgi:peptide subunit release factor 1 (eRF1)